MLADHACKQEGLCSVCNEASGFSANLKLPCDILLSTGPSPLVFSPLQLKASAEPLALELILYNVATFLRLLLPTQGEAGKKFKDEKKFFLSLNFLIFPVPGEFSLFFLSCGWFLVVWMCFC